MPNVKSLIGSQGVTYTRHYCQNAWCCPSRVSFLTGRAAHNTNVTDVKPPYGGWPKFTAQGLNDNYLPVWLSNNGINTYVTGKFLNSYSTSNLATPAPPKGWTNSSFLIDPYTYNYLQSRWTNKVNAQSLSDVTAFPGIHTTDVTTQKALAMIDAATAAGKQFFMMVTGVAPHLQSGQGTGMTPPVPSKYANTYKGSKAPRSANFNPQSPSGASWVKNLPRLTTNQLNNADQIYAARLGNLAAINDMVGTIINKLSSNGLLANTYVIFTSDNGFHIGNHRLTPGKRCPYEEDINIPLLIRGPDVAKGVTSTAINSHTDMAPTILQMLGVPALASYQFDGAPIPYTASALGTTPQTELLNVEFWNGGGDPEGLPAGLYYNNTYKALRVISDGNSFFYSKWCTGEQEFYDMVSDASQLSNRLGSPAQGSSKKYYGRSETQLYNRLDALLMVNNLGDAMKSTYDIFFANQPKVSYTACDDGYLKADEGPQTVDAFS
ncbi:hypothetical protein LTR09_005799 [Extremus antarcticus]|uniref:Sulfatase N-terminal domain-containing protein n=1 Tax=Extremus antarcticus TaxID=702011 RepID=A0AAJ0DNF8_9PEZI|nr:hypothetical protein LTR09_005799 [Extremus antarcticus]